MIEYKDGGRRIFVNPLTRRNGTLEMEPVRDLKLSSDAIILFASNLTEDFCDKIMEIDETCSYWDSVDDIFYKSYDMSIRPTCSSSLDSFKTLLMSNGMKLECFPDMINETSDFVSKFEVYEDALIIVIP